MRAFHVPAIRGDREFYRKVLSEAFTDDLLDRIEKEDPGRTEHYMEVMDLIVSAAYALTQPDGERRIHISDALLEEMGLMPSELSLLLGAMERIDLISNDEGIRIGWQALAMIPPPPKKRQDG